MDDLLASIRRIIADEAPNGLHGHRSDDSDEARISRLPPRDLKLGDGARAHKAANAHAEQRAASRAPMPADAVDHEVVRATHAVFSAAIGRCEPETVRPLPRHPTEEACNGEAGAGETAAYGRLIDGPEPIEQTEPRCETTTIAAWRDQPERPTAPVLDETQPACEDDPLEASASSTDAVERNATEDQGGYPCIGRSTSRTDASAGRDSLDESHRDQAHWDESRPDQAHGEQAHGDESRSGGGHVEADEDATPDDNRDTHANAALTVTDVDVSRSQIPEVVGEADIVDDVAPLEESFAAPDPTLTEPDISGEPDIVPTPMRRDEPPTRRSVAPLRLAQAFRPALEVVQSGAARTSAAILTDAPNAAPMRTAPNASVIAKDAADLDIDATHEDKLATPDEHSAAAEGARSGTERASSAVRSVAAAAPPTLGGEAESDSRRPTARDTLRSAAGQDGPAARSHARSSPQPPAGTAHPETEDAAARAAYQRWRERSARSPTAPAPPALERLPHATQSDASDRHRTRSDAQPPARSIAHARSATDRTDDTTGPRARKVGEGAQDKVAPGAARSGALQPAAAGTGDSPRLSPGQAARAVERALLAPDEDSEQTLDPTARAAPRRAAPAQLSAASEMGMPDLRDRDTAGPAPRGRAPGLPHTSQDVLARRLSAATGQPGGDATRGARHRSASHDPQEATNEPLCGEIADPDSSVPTHAQAAPARQHHLHVTSHRRGAVRAAATHSVDPSPPKPAAPGAVADLVSHTTRHAASAAFDELARTVQPAGVEAPGNRAEAIEALAKDAMRPLLREWIDANLNTIVERLVREEIERMAGRR